MTQPDTLAKLAAWHANEAEQRRRLLGSPDKPVGPALRALHEQIELHKDACDLLRALTAQALPAASEQECMPQYWGVNVDVDGESILSIGHDWVSGSRQLEEQDERTIIGAARHLLSFVGYGLPASTFDPDTTPQAAQAPAGWQPIESAPKDGTMFLGWVAAERWSSLDGEFSGLTSDTSQVDFCWWRPPPPAPSPEAIVGGYFDNAAGQIGDGQDITHWMPLPEPPQPQEDAA